MTKALDLIDRVLRVAITVLMTLLIVPVTLQILARYVDFVPRYIWTEEAARFCFIWIIMLGAMIAVRDDSHFDVDVLPQPKSEAGQGWARLVVHLAMAALGLAFVWYGWEFLGEGMRQTSEISSLPMGLIYVAWPMAGVVWLLFLAEKIAADIRRIRGTTETRGHDVAG